MFDPWNDRIDPDKFRRIWDKAEDAGSPADMHIARWYFAEKYPWNLQVMVADLYATNERLLAENRALLDLVKRLAAEMADKLPNYLISDEINDDRFPETAAEVERVRGLEGRVRELARDGINAPGLPQWGSPGLKMKGGLPLVSNEAVCAHLAELHVALKAKAQQALAPQLSADISPYQSDSSLAQAADGEGE